MHGALGDYRMWGAQVATLSQQYHVVAYSRRHHRPSSSTLDASDYNHRRHVDDLISLINAVGLGPAHVVGHSYGAAVAALVAMEHPEMVNSLILGEPTLFSILSDPLDKVSLKFHRIALNVVQKLVENGEQKLAVREYVNIVTGKDGFEALPIEGKMVINQNAHTLGPMLRTLFDTADVDRHQARSINTPTLVVTGEFSPPIYRAIGRELDRCMPNSELLTLAGASPGLQLQKPDDFNLAMLDFLSRNKTAAKREGN